MKPDRLILFAKTPIPGRVKTRLLSVLDAAGACELHVAFVQDACEMLMNLSDVADIELCLDAATDIRFPAGIRQSLQGEGNLGDRMQRAVGRALHDGYLQATIIGSDSPGLPTSHIGALLDASADAALGPTSDGGYYAIKCRRVAAEMFDGVRWSTVHALDDTTSALRKCGFTVETGPSWFDVDHAVDLFALAAMPNPPRHTAQWLAAHATLLRSA